MLIVASLSVGPVLAQDDEEEEENLVPAALKEWGQKFSAVKEWQGIWEISVNGAASRASAGGHMESRYEANARGSFLLKRPTELESGWDPKKGTLTWIGEGEARGGGHGVYFERDAIYGVGEDWSQQFRGTMKQSQIEFTLWFGNKSRLVSLHPGTWDSEQVPKLQRTGRAIGLGPGPGRTLVTVPIDHTWAAPIDTWYLGSGQVADDRRWQAVANGPGVLVFTFEGPTSGRNQKFEISGAGVKQRSRVLLFPVYDNLEVAVSIEGYVEWRPKGTITDPKKPGNDLTARATLRHKDGSPAGDLPKVKRFSFELIDTSREPGIAMNWPLNAKDNELDLKLNTAGTGGDLSEEDQKLIVKSPVKDDRQQPYAETKIESYDFGGRAELRVICELEDGREIVGLLKDEKGEQDLVRLPKMDGPGWVAESWRKKHEVMDLADNDDEEEVKGQEHKGDGFTLYQEYRGWVVNGKHRDGNPKRKDFFVLNQRGPDFRGGIALFERLSQLRVHSTLREEKEIEVNVRRMNSNHRDAPHRVDQHAVVLSRDNGGSGATTTAEDGVDGSRAFRPKNVKAIFMEYSEGGRGAGVFSLASGDKYQLSARDAESAWDRAVAHELLHTVGVDHHGEAVREKVVAYFQGPDAPLNPSRKGRYVETPSHHPQNYRRDGSTHFPQTWSDDRGPVLTLKWEDTRKDTFEEDLPEYERWRKNLSGPRTEADMKYLDEMNSHLGHIGKSVDFWKRYIDEDIAAYQITKIIWVGQQQGTDSGNDLCVMKYYFANAYRMNGQPNGYFVVRPGQIRAGRELCHSAEGTGGNAPSHQPQSRFGAAASGRGNCFGQICPNDAIPPRRSALN